MLGGIFDVHMEAELNPDSPLAGITITKLETMCQYRIDYEEIARREDLYLTNDEVGVNKVSFKEIYQRNMQEETDLK